jgi:hypothetical protein
VNPGKKSFMAMALWILASAAVAADKPPLAAAPCSCERDNGQGCTGAANASRLRQDIEQMLEEGA